MMSDYGTIRRSSCFDRFSASFRRAYYTFLFVALYLIPLLFICWSCFQIAKSLLLGSPLRIREGLLRRQELNRRKVAKMVLVVVAAFAISWTPYFLVSFITQHVENYFTKHDYFFTMLCINLFAFLNSSINPFIYAVMSSRFRAGFGDLARCLIHCSTSPTSSIVEQEMSIPSKPSIATKCKQNQRRMLLLECETRISTETVDSQGFHVHHRIELHNNDHTLRVGDVAGASAPSGKRMGSESHILDSCQVKSACANNRPAKRVSI